MLKKNLVRTGFLGKGLLLFVPNAGTVKGKMLSQQLTPFAYVAATDTLPSPSFIKDTVVRFDTVRLSLFKWNDQALRFAKSYVKKEREFLALMQTRSPRHFTLIDSIFRKHKLPEGLRYLAIVESKLSSKASSAAGAKGLWQFMPQTAKELGLKTGGSTDERLHPYKSTVAAARYLKALHRQFGDWLLVLAAYNSGPGVVMKAMKQSGSKNFWTLQRFLPAETRGHVKRFIGVHYYFEEMEAAPALAANQ